MALPYKTRRRLSLLILVVGLPLYIVAAVTIVGLFDRPPIWLELLIYVGLGIVWALPFKAIFRGVGQPDPDDPDANHPE
ncbi:MAG: DUF2842 domain-containing protein [Rhodobacter sp.]|nr:DUF2842 domain-containing protein [Rhodobacter sp.]